MAFRSTRFLSLFLSALIFSVQALSSAAATRTVTVDGLFDAVKSGGDPTKLSKAEIERFPKLAVIIGNNLKKGYVSKPELIRP